MRWARRVFPVFPNHGYARIPDTLTCPYRFCRKMSDRSAFTGCPDACPVCKRRVVFVRTIAGELQAW